MSTPRKPFPISDLLRIPESSRESFAPLSFDGCVPLRDAGLRLAGYSEFGEGYRVGRTRPPFHLALITVEGRGEVFRTDEAGADRRLAAGPGTILIAPALSRYGYTPSEIPWKAAWFHFDPEIYRGSLLDGGFSIRPFEDSAQLVSTLRTLIGAGGDAGTRAGRLLRLYSEILLILLDAGYASVDHSSTGRARRTLDALWTRVASGLHEPWTSARLAAEAGLSPTHLNRLCRTILGVSPLRNVAALRMRRAGELLRRTDYPVRAVAELVGYTDPFAFSTAFKREFSVSPVDYRKRISG